MADQDQRVWRKWIIEQMALKGFESQSELARAADLPQSAISQWLDPKRRQTPTVDNARKVAKAFGFPALRGLVKAGIIPAEDLEEIGLKTDTGLTIHDIPLDTLIVEVRSRTRSMQNEVNSLRNGGGS